MRIVLIGYGNIARKHLEVFRALDCEVVASCNRSEVNNSKAIVEAGIPKTYTDYLEMIDKEKPDAILNCSSFENIYNTTKELIPLGIPLLIEKPAGTSLIELTDLINIQRKHSTIVQVALNRRHYSVFQKAIEHAGGTQNIRMISVEWSEDPYKVRAKMNYDDNQLSKLLYGNSIHGLDLLDWFSGGIREFECKEHGSENFNWNMAMVGISEKNILLNFQSSWSSPVPWRVVFYATNRRYEFAPLESCKVYASGQTDSLSIEPAPFDIEFKPGFYDQCRYFLDLMRNPENYNSHSLDSTLGGMRIAEQFYHELT